jgi:hypothetical protein
MKRGILFFSALLPALLAAGATRQAINFHDAHNLQFGYDSYIGDSGNVYYHYSYNVLFAGQGAYPDPGNNIWNGFGQYAFGEFYTGTSYNGLPTPTFPQPAGNPGNPYAQIFGDNNSYTVYCYGSHLFGFSYSYSAGQIANATSAGRVSKVTLSADFYSYDDSLGFKFAAPNGTPSFLLGDSARNPGTETFTLGDVPSGTYGLFIYGQSANGVPAGTLFSVNSGNAHDGITATLNGNGPNSTNTFIEGENFVIFENVKPDANNDITITASPNPQCGVGNANAAGFTDVNGFQLIENPAPIAMAATAAQNVFAGGTASFSFSPAFASNATYKWESIIGSVTQKLSNVTKSDGAVISGVATTNLVISNVTPAEIGLYQCVITAGSTTGDSLAAPLTILTNTATGPLQSGAPATSVGYILQPGDTLTDFYGGTTNSQPYVGPNGVAGPPLFGGYTNGPQFGSLANSPYNVIPAPFCMSVARVADDTLSQYVNLGANGGAKPFLGPVGFIVTPQIGSTVVTGMRFFTASSHSESDPLDCRLEGSNSGGANWNFIYGSANLGIPAQRNAAGGAINLTNQVLKEINFANTNSYTTYRLTFTNVNNDTKSSNGLQIAEVQFLGSLGEVAPFVVQQPQSASVTSGDNVSFSVTASGTLPLGYQWQFDGTNLLAATNNVLNLTNVTLSQAGTYKVVVTNINGSTSAFATLTVTAPQSIPSIIWTNPAPITYGAALTTNQLNAAANVPGSFAYNPTNGTALNTGTYPLSMIFTPSDTVDYASVTNSVSLAVLPAPLTVTAANANRAYGQANPAFTGVIAGLTNGDNVTAAYSCAASNNSPVGTYFIVPSLVDPYNRQTNYTVTLANGALAVTQAVPIISWANPAPIIHGTPLTVNQLNAAANVPGSFAYTPTNGTVLNEGTHALSATFTPSDSVDYASVTDSVTLTVADLTLSGVAMYGAADTNGDWNGSSNVWDTVGGNAAFNVYLFTGSTNSPAWLNSGNTDASLNPALVLSPGTYVIQFVCDFQGWDPGAPCLGMNLYFNNDSTNNQISAVAPNSGSCNFSVVGNAATTYGEGGATPGSGALSYAFGGLTTTLAGFCTSSNAADLVSAYNNAPGSDPDFTGSFTLTVAVAKSVPTIVWTNPAPIIYGTVLSSNQLNAAANVPGSFAYNPTNGAVLNTGTYPLSAIFTPTDTLDYASVTNGVSVMVSPAPLTVTAASASQPYGQSNPPFTGTIVGLVNGDNITAVYGTTAAVNSPPGTYAITPALVDPDDLQTNYAVTLVNGTLTITQAVPVLVWTNPASIAYGTALSSNQLDATANVPGSFAYSPSNGAVLNAGADTLSVIFTPSNTVDYASVTDIVSLTVSGATYYVATNGADSNPGTLAAPWLTIQNAANTLAPGDTVLVRGGVYNERVTMNVSGSSTNNPITFQNYPGETPIVDGTGLAVPSADYAAGLFEFTTASYIILQGFEIRNYQTNSASLVPAGIDITGAPHDLTFISNRVHDIANFNTTANANAYGIAVHGTTTQAISNLVFQDNEIYSNTLGQSETFSLDGNVNGFNISGNLVHDNNNIGIGFIGYEGVAPNTNVDFTRNGVCRGNIVWNITASSSAPEGDEYDADGIYSDGGSNVLIELNQVYNCDLGVELASEHKGHAANNCVCRDNLLWSNYVTGISIGGYDTTVGRTLNCVITHNTLYHNDTTLSGTGEFEMQYSPVSNTFTHNILCASSQNILISDYYTSNANNTLDWNVYYAPGGSNGSTWMLKNKSYSSFSSWISGTANDTDSLFADPLFINAANANFHLSTNSPAINAGDPNFQSLTNMPAETDMDLQPRIALGRTDIGADELNIWSPTLGIAPLASNQIQLQLSGEPGHPFVWEQSDSLSNWLAFSTNFLPNTCWITPGVMEITNAMPETALFFRARMSQ